MNPSATVTHFHLREGDVVADFGAGSGAYLEPLSVAVGTSGSVYACEIQKTLVDKINTYIHDHRLVNVRPLWCDLEAPHGTKLGDSTLDVGVLVNTFFQIEAKEQALAEMARVIKKGGKLIVIDWTDSFGGLGPLPAHVVTADAMRTYAVNAGFEPLSDFPAGDHHYGVTFRRV